MVIHFRTILTSLTLLVPVSPTIAGSGPDGSVEEVTVTVSSPTSLLCEAQSYPPALVTWLRDGSPFESSHNARVLPGLTPGVTVKTSESVRSLVYGCFIISASTGGRTLQILNAKEEDAGRYTCMATNEAGETLKHYEVKVFGETPFSVSCVLLAFLPFLIFRYISTCFCTSVPPHINKNDIPGEGLTPKEVKVKVNSTLTLECAAQAFPTPALRWYKDGQVGTWFYIQGMKFVF